jgi:hypothetical protein
LPHTVFNTTNSINNTSVSGSTTLYYPLTSKKFLDLYYGLNWNGSQLNSEWSTNFHLLNFFLFENEYLMNDQLAISRNRFEGQSLIISSHNQNNRLRVENGRMIQTFTLTSSVPTMIIRLEGDISVPQYTVTLPNGQIISPQNVNQFINIGYVENSTENKGYYIFENPLLGQYQLNIDGVSTYLLDVFGSNTPPSIQMGQIINNGGSIEINWWDSDPDDDAQINLYYDTDNSGADGTLIIDGISEDDNSNRYIWNAGDTPSGDYYIYASITDSTGAIATAYAGNSVKMITANSPSSPTNLTAQVSDTNIVLVWESGITDSIDYLVYYSTTGEVNYNSPSFSAGDTTFYNINFLAPGMSYQFMVTARDSLYRESDYSNTIVVGYISATQNNAPYFLAQQFLTQAIRNTLYEYQSLAFDEDGDNLSYSLLIFPTAMSIDNNGLIQWIPNASHSGTQLVSVKVSDPGGLADSVSYYINVLDSASSIGALHFNKPIYTAYGESGTITLQDLNLNRSPVVIDSQEIRLYSTSQPSGLILQTHETQANSGIFIATFQLGEFTSDETTLLVSNQDSIWAEYHDEFPQGIIVAMTTFNLNVQFGTTLNEGWNLLGLPVDPPDHHYLSLFPNAIPGTLYGFDGSYTSEDTLLPGKGYWLRFPSAETVPIAGVSIDSISLGLMPGWNMISGASCDIPLAGVSDPVGIIIPGTLFGFNGAYVSADTIKQGNGYWIRASDSGTVTLNCQSGTLFAKSNSQSRTTLPAWNHFASLHLNDGSGAGQTLYFHAQLEDSSLLESYRLPPVPPVGTGSFDARFEGDYRLTEKKQATIHLQASQYPVIIRAANLPAIEDLFSGEGYQYALQELVNGKVTATHILKEDQPLEIKDSRVNSLRLIKNNVVPLEFMVLQNYPNPFNPETKIRYAIPHAERVEIVIYNVLGQKVKTLVSRQHEAGYYTAIWNSTNDAGQRVASGLYIYRVKAGKHTTVKKMVLLR